MASPCVCRMSRGTGLSDRDLRHQCVFVECLEELGSLIEIYGITVFVECLEELGCLIEIYGITVCL